MKEIIYHGSEKIIEMPEYGKGALNNDYGRGFYCTRNMELAKEWACGRGSGGYANKYELDPDGLSIIDLNADPYSILNWLAVLTRHRTYWQDGSISEEAKDYLQKNFCVDMAEYDIIMGYRADDSYFTFAQDFISNVIPLGKLKTAMHLGELGVEVVLKSRRAFESIRFQGYEEAEPEIYYAKKSERDIRARKAYRSEKSSDDLINDIYMIDIMREGMKNGDARIR
ncbi:MAG: DUF3990 domain-containing protein [Lachnospiraceae bacterium]|nr:DUF3990 domain-containing protein [Lachnospiraceae bacterium]